jgi:hypothetical protein
MKAIGRDVDASPTAEGLGSRTSTCSIDAELLERAWSIAGAAMARVVLQVHARTVALGEARGTGGRHTKAVGTYLHRAAGESTTATMRRIRTNVGARVSAEHLRARASALSVQTQLLPGNARDAAVAAVIRILGQAAARTEADRLVGLARRLARALGADFSRPARLVAPTTMRAIAVQVHAGIAAKILARRAATRSVPAKLIGSAYLRTGSAVVAILL